MFQFPLHWTTTTSILGAVPLFYLFRKWCGGGTCESETRMDGKTAIVTGANTGIGKETAIDLARRGATVIMACHDSQRGIKALKEVKEMSGSNSITLKILDLSSLESTREFSASFLSEHEKLHVLINNAGVGACPYAKTADGFELQFGVNHLGHFALTNLLLPRLIDSAPARIVNLSSRASQRWLADINFEDINSEKKYSPFSAYCQSKLANVLFTKELHRRLTGQGVTAYAVHPGVVYTEIARHAQRFLQLLGAIIAPIFLKTPSQGAQTSVYCAVQEGIEEQSGEYFSDCSVRKTTEKSRDEELANKLWDLSENMTKVEFPL